MTPQPEELDWIDTQRQRMIDLVIRWANINSGSTNAAGLAAMAVSLAAEFSRLGVEPRQIPLTTGSALTLRRGGAGRVRVLLGIHMDTVYAPVHPFQSAHLTDGGKIHGPGVADAKGGLAVMLVALEALERSPVATQIDWEVLINPDEEIGSPASAELLRQAAGRNDLGLLFEPALDEGGALASARGGSGNFVVTFRGIAAHAGRDFERGRNALVAAAELAVELHNMSDPAVGVTLNVARIEGGGPLNVVPDQAVLRFNVRITHASQGDDMLRQLNAAVVRLNQRDGISAALQGQFHSPPKPLDAPTQRLLDGLASCGRELGLNIQWRPTRGVCDGNKLAAAGLPTVDSLGVRGGAIHSPDEYLLIDSLTERAKLTALFLLKLARDEVSM